MSQVVITANEPMPHVNDGVVSLKRLERRDWWLWWTAFAIMLLLLVGMAFLALSTAHRVGAGAIKTDLVNDVRLLACAVLLFSLYAIYQQRLIKRLRVLLNAEAEASIAFRVRAEEFKELATLDPLTGAYNRRLVKERMAAEMGRSERYGYPLAVLCFDLNDFKRINDMYGHPAGDEVLKTFTQRLKKAIRASDTPGRLGGDEFIVVLPECHSEEVGRILTRLGNLEADLRDQRVSFEFSAGWAEYQAGESPERLLERADEALYADKRVRKGAARSPSSSGPQSDVSPRL